MRRLLSLVPPATLLLFSLARPAAAQDAGDRVVFGNDVYVGPTERVHDAVAMGGDVVVDGVATGDVVSMGGDVTIRGTVDGDVTAMGGHLELADGAVVHGEVTTTGGDVRIAHGATNDGGITQGDAPAVGPARAPYHRPNGPTIDVRAPTGPEAADMAVYAVLADAGGSLVRHLLLFLLALLLAGLVPERFHAVQAVIAREPVRVGVLGLGAGLGAVLLMAVMAISVIGIPAAVVLAVVLALACYVGLASIAAVLGAALPFAWVHGKPVRELAAGTAVLWVASLVPVAGTFAVLLAGLVGLGAVIHTRFGKLAPPPGAPLGAGPFRTAATV